MNKKFLLFVLLLSMAKWANAQNVSYNGLGRIYVTDDHLKGNIIANDTVTKKNGTGGYIIFDLGLNVHPNDMLKASAILRSRNEFGGFYGDGASFIFRQFKLEGIIGTADKGVKYEAGDLDLKMTEYTLFNNDEIYNQHEAEVFKMRRNIVAYENFNFGNAWRLQGVHLNSGFLFDKVIKKVDVDFFGTRTKSSLTYAFPDRFLVGGRIGVLQSDFFKIGGNVVVLNDAKETVAKVTYQYNTTVLTGDYQLKLKSNDSFELMQFGEVGNSNFSYNNYTANKSNSLTDFFFDLGLSAAYKPLNITASTNYRNVGPDFISPSAQTRRTYDYGTPTIFGQVNQGLSNRFPTLFDRYSQEGLYNQSITPVLMTYNPIYNNVTPYGKATPNRQGFSINLMGYDNKQIVNADLAVDVLTEVRGEGTTYLRNFFAVRGGVTFNIAKILNFEKIVLVNVGDRFENTTREVAVVDLKSNLIDAGLEVEVIKNVSVMGGYKFLTASGNETMAIRNEYNTITKFVPFDRNLSSIGVTQSIITAGTRFMLGQYSAFTLQAHFMDNSFKEYSSSDYSIAQFFASYTLKF